ncbi:hypothetical protein L1D14_23055 [Vibrio tubiashii]|uniref:hypothetical protein n=1 Tax=Vibrio tubiashii TaxID=29498 RepID=UPI001EFD5489|nr:hypothetical protein [Vibrio tubiashii]MCG9579084.1 hypothetical protein [Vibrio tubiashii]
MSTDTLFEYTSVRSRLIYKHTHKDMRGSDTSNISIVYAAPNGGTTLGHPNGMPAPQYAEHYIYALLKEFGVYHEKALVHLASIHGGVEILEQTNQWRGSLQDLECLLQNEEMTAALRKHGVIFLDDMDQIYSQVVYINHRCVDGVLQKNCHGFEKGQHQREIFASICNKLELKIEQQKKVWMKLTEH